MAYVYILYSSKLGRFYTGSCFELEKRLLEHKNKAYRDSFTTKAEDWELFLFIDNLEYHQARKIEIHIKKIRSRKYIEDLIKYPEINRKLISKYK